MRQMKNGMKRCFAVFCFLAVAAGALGGLEGAAWSRATEESTPALSGSQDIVDTVVITSNSRSIVPWTVLFEKPYSAASGYLFLALSPSEHLEFQDGRLIRYICIANGIRTRKALMHPDIPVDMHYGDENVNISFSALNFGNFDPNNGYELIQINGKHVKVVFDEQSKQYYFKLK